MEFTMPSTVHASWSYAFVDDELTQVPQRTASAFTCKFKKTDDGQFYESILKIDPNDPYYRKNNNCNEYGIRSSFQLRCVVDGVNYSHLIAVVRETPPSELKTIASNNMTYKTIAYFQCEKFEDVSVDINYNFVEVKHNNIFVGYYIKIPCEIFESVIKMYREKKSQYINGI